MFAGGLAPSGTNAPARVPLRYRPETWEASIHKNGYVCLLFDHLWNVLYLQIHVLLCVLCARILVSPLTKIPEIKKLEFIITPYCIIWIFHLAISHGVFHYKAQTTRTQYQNFMVVPYSCFLFVCLLFFIPDFSFKQYPPSLYGSCITTRQMLLSTGLDVIWK